jgi:hypothetical protein
MQMDPEGIMLSETGQALEDTLVCRTNLNSQKQGAEGLPGAGEEGGVG